MIYGLLILLIPFLGTTAGAAMVFLLKDSLSERMEKALLGFAAGVMVAASVWSLLLPSLEMADGGKLPQWFPACVGFLLGIGFLLLLDEVVPHLHMDSERPEGIPARLPKSAMLLFAVTIHNIPEGMAVGVILTGALSGGTGITLGSAAALSVGIAIQNFPEGAIVSVPLRGADLTKRKAFCGGVLSGAVEPAAGALTVLLAGMMLPGMPYLLSFAAGAMFYVVIEELIPESQVGEHSNIGTVGAAFGFALMMVLDVVFG